MKKEYSPATLSEIRHYADLTKTLPRDDAEVVQRILLRRLLEAGGANDEMMGIIDGITERFADEDRVMRRRIMEDELRRNGTLKPEHIEVDDDQVITAMKKTLPHFKSDFDWGGVYRILVDCCDYPSVKTQFTVRFWNMGIYATDNPTPKCVDGLPRYAPAIYKEEFCGHPFSYQAIQKGCKNDWGLYPVWKNRDDAGRDFADRRLIADRFRRNLIEASMQ